MGTNTISYFSLCSVLSQLWKFNPKCLQSALILSLHTSAREAADAERHSCRHLSLKGPCVNHREGYFH